MGVLPSPIVTRFLELLMGSIGKYLAIPVMLVLILLDVTQGVSYLILKKPLQF